MRHRTRNLAAAAAALALVGSAAAFTPAASAATPTPAKQCTVTNPSPTKQADTDKALAARLGVSTARFDAAMRQLKLTLAEGGGSVTQQEFDATLARLLHISPQKVQQVFPNVTATGSSVKITIAPASGTSSSGTKTSTSATPGPVSRCGKPPSGKLPAGKVGISQQSQQQADAAMAAYVAKALNLSTSRVATALAPLFAAGRADTSSAAFATAAQQLGVSVDQLATALGQAKQSLATTG